MKIALTAQRYGLGYAKKISPWANQKGGFKGGGCFLPRVNKAMARMRLGELDKTDTYTAEI